MCTKRAKLKHQIILSLYGQMNEIISTVYHFRGFLQHVHAKLRSVKWFSRLETFIHCISKLKLQFQRKKKLLMGRNMQPSSLLYRTVEVSRVCGSVKEYILGIHMFANNFTQKHLNKFI